MVFIDIFSKYLYSAPLKTLKGEEMTRVFEKKIINDIGEKPSVLQTDQGKK